MSDLRNGIRDICQACGNDPSRMMDIVQAVQVRYGWVGDEAIDLIASKFAAYKPEEVAVISSSRTSNEDNYVAQKFARAVLRTNNTDNCARV